MIQQLDWIQQLDRYRTPPSWRLQVGGPGLLARGDAWIDNLAPVVLGDRVCLSQGAYLCTGNHDFRSPGFDLLPGPITIGPEAWIAAHAPVAGMPLLTRHQRRYRQAFPGFTLISPHP